MQQMYILPQIYAYVDVYMYTHGNTLNVHMYILLDVSLYQTCSLSTNLFHHLREISRGGSCKLRTPKPELRTSRLLDAVG